MFLRPLASKLESQMNWILKLKCVRKSTTKAKNSFALEHFVLCSCVCVSRNRISQLEIRRNWKPELNHSHNKTTIKFLCFFLFFWPVLIRQKWNVYRRMKWTSLNTHMHACMSWWSTWKLLHDQANEQTKFVFVWFSFWFVSLFIAFRVFQHFDFILFRFVSFHFISVSFNMFYQNSSLFFIAVYFFVSLLSLSIFLLVAFRSRTSLCMKYIQKSTILKSG